LGFIRKTRRRKPPPSNTGKKDAPRADVAQSPKEGREESGRPNQASETKGKNSYVSRERKKN